MFSHTRVECNMRIIQITFKENQTYTVHGEIQMLTHELMDSVLPCMADY